MSKLSGRDKKLTDDQRLAIARMWMRGMDSKRVAAIFDVHPAYVRKAAARLGFHKRPA